MVNTTPTHPPQPVETIKPVREDRSIGKVFHDKLMTEIKPIHTTGPVFSKKFAKKNVDCVGVPASRSLIDTKSELIKKKLSATDFHHKKDSLACNRINTSKIGGAHHRITKRRNTCNSSATSTNHASAPSPLSHEDKDIPIADDSNIFVYIDLHGHASKKGIFMYGNFMANAVEAVECMLLPRLMSMNCHHFHFDACVFTERNMYHK